MRELLSRGIGIHHGGLLPLVKGTFPLHPVPQLTCDRGRRDPILKRSRQSPLRNRNFRHGSKHAG